MSVLALGVDLLLSFFSSSSSRRRYSCFISRGKPFQSYEHEGLLNISFQGFKSQCLLGLPLLEVYIKECCLLRRTPKSPKTWLWKEVCSSKCKYCCPLKLEALRVIYGRKIAMWGKDFITFGGENCGTVGLVQPWEIQWCCEHSFTWMRFGPAIAAVLCCPLLSPRQCFPIPQPEAAAESSFLGLCWSAYAVGQQLVVSKVVPSQLLSVPGVVFFWARGTESWNSGKLERSVTKECLNTVQVKGLGQKLNHNIYKPLRSSISMQIRGSQNSHHVWVLSLLRSSAAKTNATFPMCQWTTHPIPTSFLPCLQEATSILPTAGLGCW